MFLVIFGCSTLLNTILEKYNITSNCYVNAKAVYTGDGNWKVYEIEK